MGPSATPTTPTTGTPAPNSPASTESTFFVSLTISMPYTESAFTTAVRDKFKVAVARAAGTTSDKVQILTVTAGRRRAGGIKVETKILASDSTGVHNHAGARDRHRSHEQNQHAARNAGHRKGHRSVGADGLNLEREREHKYRQYTARAARACCSCNVAICFVSRLLGFFVAGRTRHLFALRKGL